MIKILIGEISSYKAIVIARFIKLHYSNVLVYTFDFQKTTKYIKTKYSDNHFLVFNPRKDKKKYLEELSDIVNKFKIDFFIPVNSNYIGEILKNRELFSHTLSYYGPTSSYEILNNKLLLFNFLKNNVSLNIMPKHYETIEGAEMPFVYKPQSSSSSKGVIYFMSENDLIKNKTKIKDTGIIQQYVDGVGIGFSCFAVNGEIKKYYSHLRLIEFPLSGGSSLYRESYNDNRLFDIVAPIVKKLNWSGLAMFEFKLTKDNQIYLIEVNPRVWGSINQGLLNGVNFFSPILGNTILPKNTNNYKTYVSPLIYYAFLKLLFKFKFKPILNFIKNIKHNKPDVSIFYDFNGYMSIILRKI
ncbi:MAG TPA: ATP-grasp domain-containing protein [Bacteroidales bacterium]|nr:ATP-grasp domain-containing protein [Bacteroidales bacterium]